MRRRVASVSDIDDGLKESAVAAASSSPVAPADVVRSTTMRAELFTSPSSSSKHRESSSTYWPPPEATIVIELEEYTTMANELADIKSQLVKLQNLLVCQQFGYCLLFLEYVLILKFCWCRWKR